MNKLFSFFVVGCVIFSCRYCGAQTGIITTIAGNGTEGFSGDGGNATACEFGFPGGIAVDGAGNIYIADENNYRIRKIDPAGVITTLAGSGFPTIFSDPKNLYYDTSGFLYVADRGGNRIRKVDVSSGAVTSVASGVLYYPSGVATDAGNIYVADSWNHRIRKINKATSIITTIAGNGTAGSAGDGGAAVDATLNFPTGLVLDAAGNMYMADDDNHRIRMVNTAGVISTYAGNGVAGYSGDGGPATNAQLYNPVSIALDASGNLYIADQNNNVIRVVHKDTRNIYTIAGNGVPGFSGDGGDAVNAQLYFPSAVTLDAGNNLYIADENNNRVRKVSGTTCVSIVKANSTVYVYPNPASDELMISTNNAVYSSCVVTNAMGAVLLTQQIANANTRLDVSILPPGLYCLSLLHKDASGAADNGVVVKRFLKK